MNKYSLNQNADSNNKTNLEAHTFQNAIDESLHNVGWYVVDEGDYYIGVNDLDPNNTKELYEQIYEDAQYELLEQLGYYITSSI